MTITRLGLRSTGGSWVVEAKPETEIEVDDLLRRAFSLMDLIKLLERERDQLIAELHSLTGKVA